MYEKMSVESFYGFYVFTSVFIYLSDFAISRDGPETDENKFIN